MLRRCRQCQEIYKPRQAQSTMVAESRVSEAQNVNKQLEKCMSSINSMYEPPEFTFADRYAYVRPSPSIIERRLAR